MISCSILFTDKNDAADVYENFDNANGFIAQVDEHTLVLTDKTATATNDWQRQINITEEIAVSNSSLGLTLFSIGNDWAISACAEGETVSAAFSAEFAEKNRARLALDLNEIMVSLAHFFCVDEEWLNCELGNLYSGVITAEDFFNTLLIDIFEVSPYWIKWGYYDGVIENILTDPDLTRMITGIGESADMLDV